MAQMTVRGQSFEAVSAQWAGMTAHAQARYERQARFDREIVPLWDSLTDGERRAHDLFAAQRRRAEIYGWHEERRWDDAIQAADRADMDRAMHYKLFQRDQVPHTNVCPLHAEHYDGEDFGPCPMCLRGMGREQ